MSSLDNSMKLSQPGAISANLACFMAMIMWAVGFPAAEVLIETWGALSLLSVRYFLSVSVLVFIWWWADGWQQIRTAPWQRGFWIGGTAFGVGAILLLMGQKMSDPVIPAIAAAMMPIAGAVLEVTLDKRRLRWYLVVGIMLALSGGYLATGVRLEDGDFGIGALLCLSAICLFAWGTRATTRNFASLSIIGQTAITLVGGLLMTLLIYVAALFVDAPEIAIGLTDSKHITLLLWFALASMAFAQLLWIWAAGSLGILLASFHMNAVPFYVMVTVVIFLDGDWNWSQAAGAALVAAGVVLSQYIGHRRG